MTGDGVLGVHVSTKHVRSLPAQEPVSMDMNELVHTVVAKCRSYLSEQKTVVTFEMGYDLPRTRGNQERLLNVLYALLFRAESSIQSAARTTGIIHIRTWATHGEVRLKVLDNGSGASSGDAHDSQSSLSPTECAEIISDHGGTMYSWCPYAGGASYTIILPVICEDLFSAENPTEDSTPS
jgi:hypothetical protein